MIQSFGGIRAVKEDATERSFAASDVLPWMWKRKAQTQAQLMPLVMRTEDGDLRKILSTFDCA